LLKYSSGDEFSAAKSVKLLAGHPSDSVSGIDGDVTAGRRKGLRGTGWGVTRFCSGSGFTVPTAARNKAASSGAASSGCFAGGFFTESLVTASLEPHENIY